MTHQRLEIDHRLPLLCELGVQSQSLTGQLSGHIALAAQVLSST